MLTSAMIQVRAAGAPCCCRCLVMGCPRQQKDPCGKVVVVTVASSRFGKSIALKMGDEGANVAVAPWRPTPRFLGG